MGRFCDEIDLTKVNCTENISTYKKTEMKSYKSEAVYTSGIRSIHSGKTNGLIDKKRKNEVFRCFGLPHRSGLCIGTSTKMIRIKFAQVQIDSLIGFSIQNSLVER